VHKSRDLVGGSSFGVNPDCALMDSAPVFGLIDFRFWKAKGSIRNGIFIDDVLVRLAIRSTFSVVSCCPPLS
jgi:hypothetical protein